MLNPLRVFWWTWTERASFLEALFSLYLAKIYLALLGFKKVRRIFVKLRGNRSSRSEINIAQKAVLRAQHLIFWKRSACLTNALALQSMLARRGYKSELHLGVAKAPTLKAHAWLAFEGRDLIGGRQKASFTPIASFDTD